jgi:hypothetical protein
MRRLDISLAPSAFIVSIVRPVQACPKPGAAVYAGFRKPGAPAAVQAH